MKRWLLPLLLFGAASGQNGAAFRGSYHFAWIAVESASPGAALTSRNGGGTMTFDGAGGVRIQARVGVGLEEARAVETEGRYSADADSLTLPDPARAGSVLTARFNASRSVLVASSKDGPASRHDLLVAVRAPESGAAKLEGDYGGGYFLVRDNDPRGLSTAFVELLTERPEVFSRTMVNGHVGGIDDVNRENETADSTWSLRADGTGSALFANDSDVLSGSREILVSADGSALLGFSARPGERDLLVAVRRPKFHGNPFLRGRYWMNEVGAENDFAFAPEKARFGGATGSLQSAGDGRAVLSQVFASAGGRTHVTALNPYLLSGDGTANLGPRVRFGARNIAMSEDGGLVAGAVVHPAGELTLQHGIFVALRAEAPAGQGVSLSPYGVANALSRAAVPISPGALVELSGSGLAATPAKAEGAALPLELGGVRVSIDGEPAPLRSVSESGVIVLAPASFKGPTASIQVTNGGRPPVMLTVPVAAASPGLASENGSGSGLALAVRANGSPVQQGEAVEEGETVVLSAAGLGAAGAKPRVLVNGRAAEVESVSPSPESPGVYRVTIRIPEGSGSNTPVPVAIAAADGFSDMVDLTVRPKK